MKICTLVGARPQFIKAAVFSKTVREMTPWQEVLVHTGQHYDASMSEAFFKEMHIPAPDYQLEISERSHAGMTGEMLVGIEKILQKESPDLLVLFGDTNSTLAGALAASKLHIPIAHIEAGLRSFNRMMPEEHNRIITDRLSDMLFCPSSAAVQNLRKEGINAPEKAVYEVGDIMYDSLLTYVTPIELPFTFRTPYVLLSLHRQENVDDRYRLQEILSAIDAIAEEVTVYFPQHPRTARRMEEFGLKCKAEILPPQSYISTMQLLKNAELLLTDSGGMQKEAYYLNKFCITLREETEWVELNWLGVNKLAGSDKEKILSAYREFLNSSFPEAPAIYGDGNTSRRIIELIRATF